MKIMIAYDILDPNQKILEIARQYAVAFHALVDIVSCLTSSDAARSYWEQKAAPILAEAKAFIEIDGIACKTFPLFSGLTPGECIVDFARTHQMDQIIMAIRTKSKFEKLVFGSNAQYIILNAKCPVVAVPVTDDLLGKQLPG
jgi:nucleotide-binding universal stress UspA family protein